MVCYESFLVLLDYHMWVWGWEGEDGQCVVVFCFASKVYFPLVWCKVVAKRYWEVYILGMVVASSLACMLWEAGERCKYCMVSLIRLIGFLYIIA